MIVLDDARITDAADHTGLVAALAEAFRNPAEMPARMHANLPGDDHARLLVMPSWTAREAIGVKIVAVVPSNGERGRPTIDGAYLLMDGLTGKPLAVLSAPALTALRTAGVCALAASLLARRTTKTLLVIGTGALAPFLVRAYSALCPLDRVILWGRDPRKAEALAGRLSDMRVHIVVASRLRDAVGEADVICSATSSREPLLEGCHITPGTHIDLVGSFAPEMREADTELFRRGRLFVDTETAFDESGDLIVPLHEGIIDRNALDLTSLLRSPDLGRVSDSDITIFKTVGTGLADLAVARYILERCQHADSNNPDHPGQPLAIG
jgi:ornithine cyclodeaminase